MLRIHNNGRVASVIIYRIDRTTKRVLHWAPENSVFVYKIYNAAPDNKPRAPRQVDRIVINVSTNVTHIPMDRALYLSMNTTRTQYCDALKFSELNPGTRARGDSRVSELQRSRVGRFHGNHYTNVERFE